MATLVTDIGELTTHTDLGVLHDAALVVDDGLVAWVGAAADAPAADFCEDLGGCAVIPAFVDAHTHLVFGGERSGEFAARMAGERYDGGGIASTVAATRAATDDELRAVIEWHLVEMRSQGTGLVEIKSGYGLDVEHEARLLSLAAEFTDETTFLGAHVVPAGVDRRDYVDLVTGPMLAACAPHARWGDVFCEPASAHAFDGDEAREVLTACRDAGLGLRVHGNQLAEGPGVRLAVELGAASVDHCTYLADADVDALASSDTVATLLPGVEFSTRHPYPDARRLLDAGVTVALATDCNPGTCYTSSMPFVVALAVRECGMTVAEAVWAATRGAALSLRRDDVGTIEVGRPAWLATVEGPSAAHIAYRPGAPVVRPLTPYDPTLDTGLDAG